ncbi:MAG: PE-PPE domain-containing protein, partial [Mycobacterium sp.]
AMTNATVAHADDVGLVIGGSGDPIPGPEYVAAANGLYIHSIYPDTTYPDPYANGVFTPEGLFPYGSAGINQLLLNYPTAADGFPSQTSSVGQGMTILENDITSNTTAGDTSTVFGYSQSSTIASYVMQQLDPNNTPEPNSGLDFLLIGDPSNPNGGLLERFAGFETTSGQTVSDPLTIPSLGYVFDSATPSDDYTTSIYSMEYDGFTDFPRYPLNFLSDLNAVLGIAEIHGTYLNGGNGTDGLGTGPSIADIDNATLLPGSADYGGVGANPDSLTDYYMITTSGGTDITPGADITPPLVALLPTQLQELLGPDLTYLINLGYGDGSLGYSVDADSPANVDTPFGLAPDVSLSTELSTLSTDTEQGIQNLMSGTDPYASATAETATSGQSFTDLLSALEADAANPAASLTDFANAISSAGATLQGALTSLADIGNALSTSLPAYELSLFSDNLATGDLTDALGLPVAADTGLSSVALGFALNVVENAASSISADFSGLF